MSQTKKTEACNSRQREDGQKAQIQDLADAIKFAQSKDLSVCRRTFLTSYCDLSAKDKLVFLKFFPYSIRHQDDEERENGHYNELSWKLRERWKLLVSMALLQGTTQGESVRKWMGKAYIDGTDSFKNNVQYWLTLDDQEEPIVYYQFVRRILWPCVSKGEKTFDLTEFLSDIDYWKYTGRRDYANEILDQQHNASKAKKKK